MKTYTNTGNKDTRSGFGAGLTELGKTNENGALFLERELINGDQAGGGTLSMGMHNS